VSDWAPVEGGPPRPERAGPVDDAFASEIDTLLRLAADACHTAAAVIDLHLTGAETWRRAALSANPGGASAADALAAASPLGVGTSGAADGAFACQAPLTVLASLELGSDEEPALGRIYVLAQTPREVTARELGALRVVAGRLVRAIQLRVDRAGDAPSIARRARLELTAGFTRNVFDGTTNGMVVLDLEGRFAYLNRRALEMGGYAEHEVVGAHFSLILPPENRDAMQALFHRTITLGERVQAIDTQILRKDGQRAFVKFSAGPVERDGRVVAVSITAEDITERIRTERLLDTQRRLLETIALHPDLDTMLAELAAAVEAQSTALCSIILLEPDGETMRIGAAPSLPEEMIAAVNGLKIGPAVGSCGTAIYRRAPVITRDIRTDPLWVPFRELMETHGIRSSWSAPFFDERGAVLGTLAMYAPQPAMPTEWDFRVIAFATHLAGIAVQRAHTRTQVMESEARYRDLFENANDILYTHQMDGTFISVNAAGLRAYGYTPDDIGTLNLSDIIDPASLRAANDHIREVARDGSLPAPFALLTHARDGSDVWVEVNTRVVHQPDGSRFVQGIARDVTDRKLAEDALRKSEARYRSLAENIFDVVTETDLDGRLRVMTSNIEGVLGYTAEELQGHNLIADVHPDDRRRVANAFGRASEGPSAPVQYRCRHKDGIWRWLETSATSYVTEDGERRVLAVSRDITARMRMEHTLRASEERLRTFVRNAPVILFALDESGIFTLYEGQGLERVGLHPEQFVGRSIFDVHTRQPNIIENARRALAGEAFIDVIDIRGVTFEAHHTPLLDETGNTHGMIGVLIDVDDRKRAEDMVAAHRGLLELVALGTPLEDVLLAVARTVEAHTSGGRCAIMLIDGETAQLVHAAAPSVPQSLLETLNLMPVSAEGPAPAAAAALGETVISRTIANDGRWDAVRALVGEHQVAACWSMPMRGTTGSILGTLNVFFATEREPTDGELEAIASATQIAGIAIERKRADAAVRRRSAELETMYKRLMRAHSDLEESKARLEDKSEQLERALAAERERSRRDPLTGLLNHAAITEALRDLTSQDSAVLAIAMVDVDGLKAANDTYGHQMGDAVLVLVAERLSRSGAIVGRYGGDEFVAILPGADRRAAEAYRDAVLASVADAGLVDPETGANVPVVVSVGVAVYPEEAGAVDDLIRLSDAAMYASRRQRPDAAPGRTLSRTLGGDRAAKMVGEIVPLLTSAGTTEDKLRLVAHRLSVGAGYDGVHFVVDDERKTGAASSSFARVPERDLADWDEEQSSKINVQIARILNRTRRPIVIDDLATNELLPEATRAGLSAVGLRSCLIAPMVWEDTLIGAMSVASKGTAAFSVRDAEFVMAVATQVTAIVQMSRVLEQLRDSSAHLREAHESTVMMLASAAEAHDRTTGRHLERVRLISEAIATELGYDETAAKELGMAAILHDIGKIRVPDTVLGSSQSLAEAEWVLMKQHTVWGNAFLKGQPGFELAAMVARCHHERWDGAGYPDGLAAEAIPEAAQIVTVADSFDAMTNDRPYRNGRPTADAVDEIVACSGTQFSPRVVDALVRLFERGELAFLHGDDDAEPLAA
jgi:diguanylate cyclase (GGDEF)-like protein/PAS domain S-box-containing protein